MSPAVAIQNTGDLDPPSDVAVVMTTGNTGWRNGKTTPAATIMLQL